MRALPPHAATRPPASPVGFRPAAVSASVAMTVVVVLPCVPATATLALPAATSVAVAGTHGKTTTTVMATEGLTRTEEDTSELQSLAYIVCRLLLLKKKT